jgi:hypothetical protein
MRFLIAIFSVLVALCLLAGTALAQGDEIVANLAGGRVIIHVARDAIIFGAIDQPLEAKSVPPRVAEMDLNHIGIFFGASEWQIPAAPKPVRLDHDIPRVYAKDPRYQQPGTAESDLEQIGVGFLERLRPLVGQLHSKIELQPDEPLLQIVVIGYGPSSYGPEVWLLEYHVEQQQVGATPNYLQTHVLRPRFAQLYPPEKHEAHTLVEVRFPNNLQVVPLLGLLQQNDPRIAKLRGSDPRFAKVVEAIERGQANKANPTESADFMRALLPLLADKAAFIEGTLSEDAGFRWVVPPEEPIERVKKEEDKNHPPDAPTLRRKPNPTP